MLGGCKVNVERSETWENVHVHHEGHNVRGNKKLVSGTLSFIRYCKRNFKWLYSSIWIKCKYFYPLFGLLTHIVTRTCLFTK